ncbi:MAG: multidrug MFS transporter [Nitrososphaerota archaeon]|nr:multidrug MFS transporter [Nitrososphaerota archaeon]MDG6932671.1 multidrug MFS transporter [Nitrososphaerota archaeon]MDG6936129.1 multidrug MFS transporter [Nitrososphaerota archaeon]MDG6944310.1 multidrug MFS transporter [Nitrososphaerota archaeon]
MTEIVVDYREQASELPRILGELGLEVSFRQLGIGDYIISEDLAIERKTVHDFISSIFDGRLFRQADDLSNNYKTPIILIEGDMSLTSQILNNPKIYYGALASLIINFNIKTAFVPTVEESAIFIERLAFNFKKGQKPRIIYKQKAVTTDDDQIYLISSLPGIGPKLAEKMIMIFGSPSNAFNAKLSELARVIGPTKARKIKKVLEYNRKKPEGNSQIKLNPDQNETQ